MTEDLAHTSAITQHPSGSLYDRVFALALPDVDVISAHKNVPLLDDEAEAVLEYALKGMPRKTLKRITAGNDEACFALSLAISHAIDVLAAMRFISIARTTCQMPPLDNKELALAAEDALKDRFANDKGLSIRIWRNPVEELANYIQAVFSGPMVTLPNAVAVRVGVCGAPALQTDRAAT